MRFMPTVSWRQRAICTGLAIVASCAALVLGVISAPFYAPTTEQAVIAAKIEQGRLAHILAEREMLEARAEAARTAVLRPAAAPDGPRGRAGRGGLERNYYESPALTD